LVELGEARTGKLMTQGRNGSGKGGRGRKGGAVVDAPPETRRGKRREVASKRPARASAASATVEPKRPRKGVMVPRKKTAAPPAEVAAEGTAPDPELTIKEVVPVPLTEEEQIESAKYTPRELPPRLFEEERFLFPESYGVNRLRLLVKDPEWLFAHWDVDPGVLASLAATLGERAAALSRLTLRISDPHHGGASVVLLPPGARSWYVRTDTAGRSYRAQLGLTLPSGEFRLLAESNTITAPRVGASPVKAGRKVHYARPAQARVAAGAASSARARAAATGGPGPWSPPPQGDPAVVGSRAGDQQPSGPRPEREDAPSSGQGGAGRGGASDVYRR
jgi:hypothetical protein